MTPPNAITDSELNAYVDGELDAGGRAEAETWFRAHPEDGARAEAYARQNSDLHALFDPILDEGYAGAICDLMSAPLPRVARPAWMRAVAMVALVTFGAAAGWGLRGPIDRTIADGAPAIDVPGYVARAIGAYRVYSVEVLHPVEVAADREEHLVGWLSKRLGSRLNAPRLDEAGYRLIGGRLLEETGRPAAQFMYEDGAGRRLTVYLRPSEAVDSAFKFARTDEIRAFYWIDAPFAYALTGAMSREELLTIAHLVYRGLER